MLRTMSFIVNGAPPALDRLNRPSTVRPCLSDESCRKCGTAAKVGYSCYNCIGATFPVNKRLFRHADRCQRSLQGKEALSSSQQLERHKGRYHLSRRLIHLDMNRVEGDLQIKLEVEGNTVTDAWCIGSMYRGYEQVLIGREPTDALVFGPRICGICSTSHLYAAALALEDASQLPVTANATRIRNLCLMAEAVMNDARHTFLMFAPDFCNPAYKRHPLFEAVLAAFEPPFRGRLAREMRTEYKAHPGDNRSIWGAMAAFHLHDAGRSYMPAGT